MPCSLTTNHDRRPLDLSRHHGLHPEGGRLISSWFSKAWSQRWDEDAVFESFIFAWFSVNAWAACVTGVDRDSEYIKCLQRDAGLGQKFTELIAIDPTFNDAARRFHSMWPIFKAQSIRRARVQAEQGISRAETVRHYFEMGVAEFEPDCWRVHQEAGEAVPLDWAHTLQSIYRVRCNLFHGEKSAHSEMDRAIVRAAFDVLIHFFRGAQIL